MNSFNSFQLKIIPNFSYKKEKLSVALRNKDFYLFNLLHKKNLMKNETLKLLNINNNRANNNKLIDQKNINQLKELNMNKNNFLQKKDIKSKYQDEVIKNIENNFNNFYGKTQKKPFRHNSTYFLMRDKIDIEPVNNIKNPLVITSLFKNNNNIKEKNRNKKKKLKIIKKNSTFKILNKDEIEKMKKNYIISNSIIKKERKKTKINEGAQVDINIVNYYNYNTKIDKMFISRNNFCSPKSIIFQREFSKYKSADNKRYN